MAEIFIRGELAETLQKIAAEQDRSVEAVLWSMYRRYIENKGASQELRLMLEALDKKAAETSPLEAFIGMFDDVEATDLSIKASGHMGKYFTEK